jgi:hypothetical protein
MTKNANYRHTASFLLPNGTRYRIATYEKHSLRQLMNVSTVEELRAWIAERLAYDALIDEQTCSCGRSQEER